MKIIKSTSTSNTTQLDRIPTYIAIHYTAGTKSTKGKALEIAKMFSNSNNNASADFIIDDEQIVQYNPDPTKYYCWAVGGSKYPTSCSNLGGRLHGIATNKNCVNIELCSSKINSKSLNASDTDWYFTDEVIKNGIELTRYLMKLYNIPIKNVIMHHEVTGKICPNPFCVDENALIKWREFKGRVNNDNKYKKKKYTFIAHSNIRNDIIISSDTKVKTNTLSKSMQKQCIDREGDAVVKEKGKITIVQTFRDEDGNYWGKTKSGHYIVLEYKGVSRVKV